MKRRNLRCRGWKITPKIDTCQSDEHIKFLSVSTMNTV